MRGKYPIDWIWNWFGLGSMGEDYELLNSVQPVVPVVPWPFPHETNLYFNTVAQVAGTVVQVLPLPTDNKFARIWWTLAYYRSVVAAGDGTQIRRFINGQWRGLLYSLIDPLLVANSPVPVIGTRATYPIPAGSIAVLQGRNPALTSFRSNIQIDSVSAAAVGNFVVEGLFTDIPINAQVPWEFYQ